MNAAVSTLQNEQRTWANRVATKARHLHEMDSIMAKPWDFPKEWGWFLNNPETAMRVRKIDLGVNTKVIGVLGVATENCVFPSHWHRTHEEVLVLRGRGSITVNGDKTPVQKGSYLSIPAGDIHSGQYVRGTVVLLMLSEIDYQPGEVSTPFMDIRSLINVGVFDSSNHA